MNKKAVIPDQAGRIVVVTGANSGIGFETAKALAAKSATVVLACRNLDKAHTAAADLRSTVTAAKLDVLQLDLADLASVRAFAENFKAKYQNLDLLINNAGVMVPPFGTTQDGYELQFGANHLGHFALTGLVLDRLLATPQARVVTLSSAAHRQGTLDFHNLQAQKGYRAWAAYGQSKLANLLFTAELQRRLHSARSSTLAVAAHPGWTGTNLQQHSGLFQFLNTFLAMPSAQGALPTLYAATSPDVQGGDYIGPDGFMEMRGYPQKVGRSDEAKDAAKAKRLWSVSEDLTNVSYQALDTPPG